MYKHLAAVMICLSALAAAQDEAVPLQSVGHKTVLPLKLNGVGPYPCVLDLGAPGAVIDSEVGAYLQLPAAPAGGFQLDSMEAGTVAARNLTVAAADLKPFKRILGAPVAGIVNGREFGPRIAIDFPAGTANFSAADEPLAATGAGVVPFEPADTGAPVVSALINGQHVRPFVVDSTLAATLSVPEPMLRELGLLTDATPRLELDTPPAGRAHPGQTQIRLGSVRVGAAEVGQPVCDIAPEGQPARLGMGFLRRFRMRIDWGANLLELQPADAANPVNDPPLHGYGVGLWKFNGAYWMIYVAKGSPAAEAGLVSGGILMSVDGKDIKGVGREGVEALLQPHQNAKAKLAVLQGDDTREVELTPRTLL